MKWLLLAFLGVAAASQIPSWSPDKEYTFHYTTAILSGIPKLGRQHAGLKLTTIVRVQRFPDQTVRIQFQDSKFKNYNEEIEWDSMSPWSSRRGEQQDQVPSSIKRHLESPFKVVTNDDLVEKIQSENSEPEYITNIKKAAISQLLTLSQSRLTDERKSEFLPSLHKMETSIVGQCETQYTVSRLPEYLAREFEQREQIPKPELCDGKEYYEVIKTKDLKACKERPIYQQVYGANSVSDGSMGSAASFADEASVTRAVICGRPDSYSLRKVTNEHRYLISPSGKFENEEKMSVTSASSLALRSVEQKGQEIPDVRSPKPRGSLMYEFPSEEDLSSQISKKSMIPQQRPEAKSREEELEDEWYQPQIAQPDMVSAPHSLYPNIKTNEERKEELSHAFLTIVENAQKSPESSHSHEDVAGITVRFSRTLARLSLEDIKSLWRKIESRLSEDVKETADHSFLDLVSICGTNPCVKYIIDAVKSRQLSGESGAWIVSNAIRSVKTPTKALLQELTDLLKHQAVQSNRNMASTVALSLTHLVHKACIDETSSVYDFPAKAFGRFCDQKSPIITKELIPFLADQLSAAGETDINKIISYINALGNLGHDGAALHLLRAVEGRPSRHPHPRSVAVYQLVKAASRNPVLYRPVILALIENQVESEEVRMAAVTVLPYTRPHSSHLNTLAIRTWWEPSRQVAAYITTTLKTLAELPIHNHLYNMVSEQAQQAYRLAKPTNTGIQMSHNAIISQFLDTLKAAVNFKLQYVTIEQSAFPKNIFLKDSVVSKSHSTQNFEAAINFQGAEYIINKMYEAYSALRPQQEQQRMDAQQNYIKNIVHVESRWARKPEAHVTVKVMGLQRIFSFDNKMVAKLMEEITKDSMEALKRHNSLSKDFMKIIDLNGNHAVIPSESGLPVYISHRTPLVISGKASLKTKLNDMKNGEASLAIHPVVNYKQISQAGVLCPFSKSALNVGVDTNVHVAVPVEAEVTMKDGHYFVSVSTPRDEESQKEKPVFQLIVKPYTTAFDITSSSFKPASKTSHSKTIKSRKEQQRKEYHLGQALGLNLRLKIETEQSHSDLAEFVQGLLQHKPLTLLTLPLPIKTVRDHSISLFYNPRGSNTKDASLAFSFGYGQKQQSSQQPEVTSYSRVTVPDHVERQCREEARRWKEDEQRDAGKIQERKERCERRNQDRCQQDKEHEQRRLLAEQEKEECRRDAQNKCHQEKERELREEEEEKKEKCEKEKLAAEEKEKCKREQTRHSHPSYEVESHCNKKSVQYKQMHTGYKSNMKSLQGMLKSISNAAKAVSINVQAALHGESYSAERKVEAQFTISEDKSQGSRKENQLKLKVSVKTPHSQQPYNLGLHAHRMIERPSSQWDRDAMLREDISSKINIKAQFGRKHEQQQAVQMDIQAERSAEQKAYARNSQAWRKCDSDLAKNQQLSESCKESRHHAASLDVIQAELSLPKQVARSPYMSSFSSMAMAYFMPYLSIEATHYNRKSGNQEHYRIDSKIAPNGGSFTVNIEANNQKTVLRNVRIASSMKGLVPFCVMKSLPMHLIEKVTQHRAPSTCVVEGNKVETFDKVIYDYTLNDCEHVIFKDCTEVPKVLVSVRKTSALHIVKVVIDDNKYEVELVKAARGSRAESGKVNVNGQAKQRQQQGRIAIYEEKDNQVTRYEDGVYEIYSAKYGMKVRADSQSVEVVTFQHRLRNLACGLCGDLNDEKAADVRSAKQCVMSSPRLAAYSFMVEDRKCAGIPSADREKFNREAMQCLKKEVAPSKVYDLFTDMQKASKMRQASMQHVDQRQGQNICISKSQVKVCGSKAQPSVIIPKEMAFFCVAADKEGRTLQRMAQRGERIDRAERFPTAYTATVFEARNC